MGGGIFASIGWISIYAGLALCMQEKLYVLRNVAKP